MKEESTRLFGYPIIGTGRIVMEFDASGWRIVEDTRSTDSIGGYLHIGRMEDGDVSADEITEAVRNNMIKYYYYHGRIVFNNPQRLPALGATPLSKYMDDLSYEEMQQIGNGGKRAIYNG